VTDNKTQEIIDRVSQQVGQTWTTVQPQLQSLLLKLVKILLPALSNLQTKLIPSDATTSEIPSNPTLDKALKLGQKLSAQVIAALIVALIKLQQSLGNQEVTIDASGEPAALLSASAEPSSELAEQVKKEFGVAWKFVKEQVTPKILEFFQFSVDKLDPIATNIWQKVTTKAAATPSLVEFWEKLQGNDAWKKTVTATAPIWGSINGIVVQVPLSDEIKRILDKRAGAIALATLFSLLIILKPSHAHSQNIKKIAKEPAPVGTVAQKQPNEAKTAPSVSDLVNPERADAPLTSEQIAIAKIQAQVSEVANQYGESLLGSVQTNFKRGRLIVALNDNWYKLDPNQQTQLVTDLQNRTRSFNFKKLLVADAENHLIARSPVTGDEVIILRH
jgi:hypothetical protein